MGLSLPIELGGKRGARTTSAQAAVATGEARVDQIVNGVLDDVRHAYIDVAGATEHLRISQDVSALFVRARDVAHTRFTAGEVRGETTSPRRPTPWPRKPTSLKPKAKSSRRARR